MTGTLAPPLVYASEADLLNVALFGMTAAQWRAGNSGRPGNIRDYATLEQLVVLSNMESINALFSNNGLIFAYHHYTFIFSMIFFSVKLVFRDCHRVPPMGGRGGMLPVVYPRVHQRYGFFMTDTLAPPARC